MSIRDIILSGTDQDLDKAMNAPHALVVDRGSEEPEVLSEFARFVPGSRFSHRFDDQGTCHVEASYEGRSTRWAYKNTPYNCFRIVQDVQKLIAPDIVVRVYAPTIGDDTHVFVPLDRTFWRQFDGGASESRKGMFEGIEFLDSAWELSGPSGGDKKWWQFWK